MKYIRPKLNKKDFHCPFCGVHSHQMWEDISTNDSDGYNYNISDFRGALCNHCKKISIWKENELIYPDNSNMPLPNEDLEADIKLDYNEAASIVEKSPRAAAALLRLAIQKLCKQLGEKGKKIDKDIGSLVKKGLSIQIKQALDIVRVIGNDSVHPGEINLNDDKEIAYKLFELVNLIAQDRITQPKEIAKLHSSLPKKKLESISKRDSKKE